MQKLPPLNGMKAFEAAGRTGSFALAARELGVSPAAVSQQVKNLESWFGKQLFIRSGNRIALTDAGQAIYPQTFKAFSDISDMALRLSEGEMRPRFVVSVPFSLAEFWLAPRLAKLLDLYPQMTFDIRVEDDPVDMKRNNADIRISYGEHHYTGLTVIPLLHDDVLPVCAPEFWYRHGGGAIGLAEVPDSMFIHTNWGETYASHPSWADWFARTGSKRRPDPSSGRRVGLSSLAITVARLGLGIALGQRSMAMPDLEAGRLIALSSTSVRLGHPYRALLTKAKAERPDIVNFIAMLGKM
ncbi:MAG: LysR substrate-binding domain-containing protein [Rhizobium sp.]